MTFTLAEKLKIWSMRDKDMTVKAICATINQSRYSRQPKGWTAKEMAKDADVANLLAFLRGGRV